MPSLGTDMEAGTLVEWLVQPGAHVKRGDIIAVVETEKGIIDIEVFETGVVEQLLVAAGDKGPCGHGARRHSYCRSTSSSHGRRKSGGKPSGCHRGSRVAGPAEPRSAMSAGATAQRPAVGAHHGQAPENLTSGA